MSDLSLAAQTLFAELVQRALDAEFDERYNERGGFVRKRIKNRLFWYYQRRVGEKVEREYVGPVRDEAINERVKRFSSIKSDYKQRREMVQALIAARLPRPDPLGGAVVEALARAGFFRLRGVLVGTLAYQCYAGLLGVRLTGTALMTQDADFAQFWGVSKDIGESLPPMLEILETIDPTFAKIPHLRDPFVTTGYRNAAGFRVEFLTPNRGSEKHQDAPARMPALGGVSAQPLRHLDYLIHEPERSVLLHGGGVAVTIPRAERFAVHKLIVAAARRDRAKSNKDVAQAGALIEALASKRPFELAEAWEDAWAVGPQWRGKLESGAARLSDDMRARLEEAREKRVAALRRSRRKRVR
jgi:hypothetical protein